MSPRMITAEQGQALDAFLALDHHLWYDIATSLGCTEAEVIVEILRAFGQDEQVCEQIIEAHAEADDEGDSHWQGTTDA